ncbi:MAG: GTP-binding protein [Nitrospirota bacterium]|nr:GTP-binding protein [Nitrospirota bacterium]
MMTTKPSPVPLYVLCGPLGAGKTTLLMQLLKYWQGQGKRVGVLMNEAGEISLDGPRAALVATAVCDITGGCACCDARADILGGLKELVVTHRAEIIVLECSGMANVEDLVDAVTDPLCQALVVLTKVIALVQPVPVSAHRAIGTRFADLVRYADDIILNKQDLYAPSDWERFRAALVRDNRVARLWQTTKAEVEVGILLKPRPRLRASAGRAISFGAPPRHPLVVTIRLPRPIHRHRFTKWFNALPEEIERAKGLCRFTDSDALHEVQYASPATRWVGIIRLPVEPDHAMVLIGRDYDLDRCRVGLRACLSGG